jgi:dsDNA-specific endonuclease/ATPase MutS2
MNKTAMNILEFPEIVRQLSEHALSESGRARCLAITPETDPDIIALRLRETEEARAVSGKGGVPLSSLGGMEKVMEKLGKTVNLTPDELSTIRNMNRNVARMMRFMRDRESIAPTISTYAASMDPLEPLSGEIDRCILDNRVDDRASADLARLRKRIAIATDRIRQKLDVLLNAPGTRALLQDSVVGMRGNHYVIPVKREHRQRLDGQVRDVSSSGATVCIEPAAIRTIKNELDLLRLEEEQEVYRVLATLTQQAETHARALRVNLETMAEYDYLFARAKLANGMRAINPALHRKGHSVIVNGRHPLLPGDAVPLNFHIGDGYRALIITGPNTGGKTVVLKTVGLFHLMAQSGLHVPAAEGTTLAVYDDILADIGDGQSITQSLSTFSSHIRNIIAILACAGPRTLAIVDELGTGTDPGEGMGLAVAVMEKLYEKGATLLATTHYSEIKAFASTRPGFKNGCMGFDVETLMPRYTLSIGIPGESNAFLISLRLGMDPALVERAHHITYQETKSYRENLRTGSDPTASAGRGMGSDPTSGADRATGSDPTAAPPVAAEVLESHEDGRQRRQARHKARMSLAQEKRRMASPYKLGDCVFVTTMNRTGIVCETENPRGEIGVMIMKKRFMIPHQRIRPFLEGKDLYPEDYDLSTVLDSVQTRKARHKMGKRHVAGLQIVTPGEDNS